MRKYTRSHEFRKIERAKSIKEWLVETEREKRRWGERKKKKRDKKGKRNKEHTIINKCMLFPRPRDTPLRWVCLKKKKKISRAIDQQMSESKFCSDLQSHLSCILSFPYHPSHHLHLLPSFTRRLSASIKTIAQIFNHLTWTPTWLPPTAEPKQFIILLFQLRNAKCTRSETTVMFNTFFFSCFLLYYMANLSSDLHREGKISEVKWKCKRNKILNIIFYNTLK